MSQEKNNSNNINEEESMEIIEKSMKRNALKDHRASNELSNSGSFNDIDKKVKVFVKTDLTK